MKREDVLYIEYRLRRGRDTLDEAAELLRAGYLYGAVNRLYYACFHAVSALLFAEGQVSSKHSGVRSLFNQHWIRTGRLSPEMGQLYRSLFDLRQDSDYGAIVSFERLDVEHWFDDASHFVQTVVEKARQMIGPIPEE